MSNLRHIKDRIAYYSRHNFLLTNEIRKIQSAEKLNGADLQLLKEKEAIKKIKYAVSNSEFYKSFYRNINLDAPFHELYSSLPVLHKNEVKNNALKIVTAPLRLLKKAHTSGTSGSPLEVYRSANAILKENAYVWYFRMGHGLHPGDRIVSMRGNLDNKTLHYFNKAENTLYLSSYQLSRANISKYAQLLADFKPKAIIAFPSSAFSLINLLEDAGVKIDVPMIFTSSETVYPFQRERIENGFNATIYDWYGNAERSISLGQCKQGNYHEMPLYGISEFTDDGVITTSLINKAFPLIRYYVDDKFKLMDKSCSCGKGIGISAIEGRVDDVVMLPDGTRVGRLGVAFQGIGHLKYAQIVQEEVSSIRVNMVTGKEFSQSDQDYLLSRLRQRLNESLVITFNKVEEEQIIKTRSGKFKLVISKVC